MFWLSQLLPLNKGVLILLEALAISPGSSLAEGENEFLSRFMSMVTGSDCSLKDHRHFGWSSVG